MAKSRPIGVTIIAILAILAAIMAFIHALQMIGLFPINIPGFGWKFFGAISWLGGIMWAILGLIYLWVFRMLWNLNPQGWLFVVVVATFNLILAVVSILGASTFGAMLPSILFNGIILLYSLTPGVKNAFGQP
jgi:hypothetical protein